MNRITFAATMGIMALPLGVYLIVEGERTIEIWFGYGMYIIGFLLLLTTWLMVKKEDKRNREEQLRHYQIDDDRFELQTRIFAEILDELRRLNSKGNTNEQDNKPSNKSKQ